MNDDSHSNFFAAVDLGSNSFHMKIARVEGGELDEVDRLRERVRLAAGLKDKTIDEAVLERAFDALRKFGERLRDIPAERIRAVGTNTLRQVKRPKKVLGQASDALGHAVEIISGQEEARLIYVGVAHSLPSEDERRLVIDIGGGSTECIIGENFDASSTASLFMGCVSYTERFFPKGVLTAEGMNAAETTARQELEGIETRYRELGWDHAFGSSGTILAIQAVLEQNGWGPSITRKGLKKLSKAVIAAEKADRLRLEGLNADRAPVFPGGVAILKAAFDALEIESMDTATGALREGVLYDLIGRHGHDDARERTILRLVERYRIDTNQADRVERTALAGLEHLKASWGLQAPALQQYLVWASRLHEIGLSVSYSGYHRHGGYITSNSEMPGFSRNEQRIVAALIVGHRRKLGSEIFVDLTLIPEETALKLAIILRISVLLNRRRTKRPLPPIAAAGAKGSLTIAFPNEWLAANPLTAADLQTEAKLLKKAGYQLQYG